MRRLVRVVLLVVIALLLVAVVIAFAGADTGPLEKAALAGLAVLLLAAASQLRRLLA